MGEIGVDDHGMVHIAQLSSSTVPIDGEASVPGTDLGSRLVAAVRAGQVLTRYQRIVELPTLRTVQVEALARWLDPITGSVPPEVFVPIAAEMGVGPELDLGVLARACGAASAWRTTMPDLTVATNLAAVTLASPDVVERILGIIDTSGLDPSAVWIEVREAALSNPSVRGTMAALRSHGLRISLEDIGTGWCDLAALPELPLDAMKLDRSLVVGSLAGGGTTAIVRSLVGLGADLGLAVVAEGIESEVEERVMRRLGVRLLQGFRYGAPHDARVDLAARRSPIERPLAATGAIAAPLPADEQGRLVELAATGLLDTEPEPGFDALTTLAAEVCAVPVSLVSLVDRTRQWFKSSVGLDAPETSREVAFCAHAILGDGPFVVEDASLDERFAGNPLVTGDPHVRFYAGVPLVTAAGHALGTLCVIDQRPRRLAPEQLRLLEGLAAQAVAQIELRLANVRLTEALKAQRHVEGVLRHRATLDHLTGLLDRSALFGRLEAEPELVGTGMLVVDVDDFSEINDRVGYHGADALLVDLAELLQRVVGADELVGRLAGDRFAIVATSTGRCRLQQLADAIHGTEILAHHPDGTPVLPQISTGWAIGRAGDDVRSLLVRAEAQVWADRRHRGTAVSG
jgi:diguanylate cyclase (GGDEF)-like protein